MTKFKIYLASSWQNKEYEQVLNTLRLEGYETYDFKHPENKELSSFDWEKLDKKYNRWTCSDFKKALNHPETIKAFQKDFQAMQEADICVLLLPCGRSAHSEAGWKKGTEKNDIILELSENPKPELMYRMYDDYLTETMELIERIKLI